MQQYQEKTCIDLHLTSPLSREFLSRPSLFCFISLSETFVSASIITFSCTSFGRAIILSKLYSPKSKKNSRITLIKMFKIYRCLTVNWNDKTSFLTSSLVKTSSKRLSASSGFGRGQQRHLNKFPNEKAYSLTSVLLELENLFKMEAILPSFFFCGLALGWAAMAFSLVPQDTTCKLHME